MKTNYNYSYTAIPTKLMLLLDNRLQSVLFNLIQLSSIFADESGYFFRSMNDLKKAFGMSENLVRASMETLFRNGLLAVKSSGYRAGKRGNTNYFRVNFEKFNQWEHLTLLEIYNLPKEEKITLVNYKDKDYRITYTADTENKAEKTENTVTLVTVSPTDNNGLDGFKTAKNKVETCKVERRNYISPVERKGKIVKNANILIERLRQTTNWKEYQRKMTLFEKWLDECCNTINDGSDLKSELYVKARHTMDEIEFEKETPTFDVGFCAIDEILDDCPLMEEERKLLNTPKVSINKRYIYCGDEAEGEEMTIQEAKEKGYKLYLLKDPVTNLFYCP